MPRGFPSHSTLHRHTDLHADPHPATLSRQCPLPCVGPTLAKVVVYTVVVVAECAGKSPWVTSYILSLAWMDGGCVCVCAQLCRSFEGEGIDCMTLALSSIDSFINPMAGISLQPVMPVRWY